MAPDVNNVGLTNRPEVKKTDEARAAENVRNTTQRRILFGTFIGLIVAVLVMAILTGLYT